MRNVMLQTLLVLAFASPFARAACEITVDRTPCPGKETEARKPYNNVNPTKEEDKKATTAEACAAAGKKAAKIVRKGVLAKKSVVAMFDGKEAGKSEDSAECK